MRERLRARLLDLGLAAAGLAVAGLLFEIGVRALAPQPASPYRFAPDTYYEPVPGAEFVYRRREFAIPVRFNSYGMRDVARRLEKPAGGLRVALLGDSFVEALQVPLDSTAAQLLERELQVRLPGRQVEVLNFGVSGFGTVGCAARYRALASRFRPDVVVYFFVDNDPWDAVGNETRLYAVHDGTMRLRRVELGPVRRFARSILDGVKHHLHAYRFLRQRLLVLQSDRALVEARERAAAAGTEEPLPGEAAWQRVRQALELLERDAGQAGARLLVVQASTRGADMDGRLAGICVDLQLPFLNLVPALRADPGPVLFPEDGHWRGRGHVIASREMAPAVARLLAEPEDPAVPPADP